MSGERIQKVNQVCADPAYKAEGQEITFHAWLDKLRDHSRALLTDWDEEGRRQYYEGQPQAWLDSYVDGMSPADAFESDRSYWD